MLHTYSLGILLCVVGSLALYDSMGDVVDLTSSTFDQLVLNSNEIWVVEFYAPWCGHCKNLAPEYKKAAKALKGVVKVGAVDADKDNTLSKKYGVTGFPTIKIFSHGNHKPYNGQRTADGIVDAALKAAKESVYERMGRSGPSSSEKLTRPSSKALHNHNKVVLRQGGNKIPPKVVTTLGGKIIQPKVSPNLGSKKKSLKVVPKLKKKVSVATTPGGKKISPKTLPKLGGKKIPLRIIPRQVSRHMDNKNPFKIIPSRSGKKISRNMLPELGDRYLPRHVMPKFGNEEVVMRSRPIVRQLRRPNKFSRLQYKLLQDKLFRDFDYDMDYDSQPPRAFERRKKHFVPRHSYSMINLS